MGAWQSSCLKQGLAIVEQRLGRSMWASAEAGALPGPGFGSVTEVFQGIHSYVKSITHAHAHLHTDMSCQGAFPTTLRHKKCAFPTTLRHKKGAFPTTLRHKKGAFPTTLGHKKGAFPITMYQKKGAFPTPLRHKKLTATGRRGSLIDGCRVAQQTGGQPQDGVAGRLMGVGWHKAAGSLSKRARKAGSHSMAPPA